ncbi:ribonuclease P protein component [Pseudochelatococcus sp. G4_1912]|uniref:ribonuclease P protein component n=1 Tax=Pseudochelatococcus sp. G4_1912 TaxID=3114288 RepID=UPI0039C61B53
MNNVHGSLADVASSSELGLTCGGTSVRLPRLLKRAEFLAVASGRRVHSSRMTVQIRERNSDSKTDQRSISGPRFGLTVTKKTANAVGRNRIRRRLRALLYNLRPFWPDADIDFVIVGRAEMLTAGVDVITSDLKRAFSSPPRQGNPRDRRNQQSHRGRGKGGARSHDAKQRNPTDQS